MKVVDENGYFGTVRRIPEDLEGLVWPEAESFRSWKLEQIKAACERDLKVLRAQYPESEVLSWYKQEEEARAFQADSTASTPLINGIAAERGITRAELVDRIIQKADSYTAAIGALLGKRQALEDQLDAATDWQSMSTINW